MSVLPKKKFWSINNTAAGATRSFSKEAEIKTNFEVLNPLLLPTDAHNVKKRRVIKTF